MKPRPILAGAIALLILQSLPAANVAPVLSGVGKLIFPENSVSAYLQASSGNLTVSAGATNGNVILSPTGTGQVGIGTSSPGIVTTAGRRYLTIKGSTLGGVTEYASAEADADTNVVGTIQATDINNTNAEHRVASIQFLLDGTTATKRGGRILFVTKADNGAATSWGTLDRQGNWGFGGNTSPAYPVDATGDINASTGFRSASTKIIDVSGNVSARGAANTVFRCTGAGALPIGALTINSGNCGTSADTGFRAN